MATVQELERLVDYHNRKYWLENKPEISDQEFDQLYQMLKELDPDNPVLHKFYFKPSGKTITHPSPMLSLEKVFTTEDLLDWVSKLKGYGVEFLTISPKYDGISGSLIYWGKNPKTGEVMVKLATRGDGIRGEDISNRLPFIKINLDKSLLISEGIQKGELIIRKPNFEKFMNGFSHPRNAVAGLMNPKREEAPDLLKYVEFVDYRTHAKDVHIDNFESELKNFLDFVEEEISEEFPLDGIVVMVSEKHQDIREQLGCTSDTYKYAIALKFPSEVAVTELLAVEWNVSRAGRVVPTAIIQETFLEGAKINRATLHNYQQFLNLNLSYLCLVKVERAGMTVPQILAKVVGTGTDEHFEAPSECPSCGSELFVDGVDLVCYNPLCRDKAVKSVTHFVQTLDIKNVSEKTIEKIYKYLGPESFSFISIFQPLDVIESMGFGPKRSKIIHDAIWSILDSKVTLSRFLSALGIPKVSKQFKDILKFFNSSFDDFMDCNDYTVIHGIGENINKILNQYKPFIREQKELFENIGMKFKPEVIINIGPFVGFKFLITGKLSIPRKEVIKFIEQHGGEMVSGLKSATHLVIGEKPSTSKLSKAREYGVSVVDGDDLLQFNL